MHAPRPSPIAPLPGPAGLYNVSVMPRFLRDSRGIGWQGAFFTTFVTAPEGQVDHAHKRYCLQRMFAPTEIRVAGSASWNDVPLGFSIWQPGDELRRAWRRGRRNQFLFLAPEHVEQVLGCTPPRLPQPAPRTPVQSHALERIFDGLDEDLVLGSPAGPLFGDGLIVALIAHLAGLAERSPRALAAPARERVVAYIDEHLALPLSLVELAHVAGVGVRQFSRAFRTATGESPHQFLLSRRVEHAKSLIANDVPLAEVAGLCGFADQSQFTRTFARRVGTTPSRYRLSLRG